MRFILDIKLGNDAMQTYDDVITALLNNAAALSDSTAILSEGDLGHIFDVNGNNVGYWFVR
jgi:hypothetical protein